MKCTVAICGIPLCLNVVGNTWYTVSLQLNNSIAQCRIPSYFIFTSTFRSSVSVGNGHFKSSDRTLSSNIRLSTGLWAPPVSPKRKAFYHPNWGGEKGQITSEATPAAHKEVLRWTMELPWAPPLSPSWAAQPELNQSLGSEQPHGWPKCSHHNLIVIVLPSNVKGISFQYHGGIGV